MQDSGAVIQDVMPAGQPISVFVRLPCRGPECHHDVECLQGSGELGLLLQQTCWRQA